MSLTTADFKDKLFITSEKLLVSETSGCFSFYILSGFSWVSLARSSKTALFPMLCVLQLLREAYN